jgi:asparagine synthase (glutamine-hydrolysing)
MCGIAGAVFWDGSEEGRDLSALVGSMVGTLGHRGPDGRGLTLCGSPEHRDTSPSVALGHTRLAILDLSDRAAQPMQSDRARTWITYNGEIYNFATLRRELEARGRRFRSDSDTEVILAGYEEWGEDVVTRLQGMFALAIWNGERNELLLARDRLGIKPLYVYQPAGGLLFASEIRALLATGLVPRRLDVISAEQFLAYQTVPSPRTLVHGVRLLAPGHLVVAGAAGDRLVERRYWDLLGSASSEAREAGADEARTRVGELLAQSVAAHLVSDVPVGIFLSGGIDSSALVALTERAGAIPHTFSVVLPGTTHDEAPFARAIANRFGSVHTEIALSERDLTDQVPSALASVDHPSGDGLNTFVISRAVRSAGFKVALSGLGGDELFGGYPSFDRLGRLATYAGIWRRSPAAVRAVAAAAVRALGGSSIASVKAAAVLESDGTLPQAYPTMRQLFAPADRAALLGDAVVRESQGAGDPYVELLGQVAADHPEAGLMSMVSYAEARTYMHDVLLRDTDQMSMASGLEVRVPLLDHRLVEYLMGLPDAVKLPRTVPKRLLVESLGSALPDDCVRRRKQGFVLPFDLWMKGDLRSFCEHHLGPHGLAGRGFVREPAVQALWAAYLAGDRRTSWSRPWALVALNAWLEQNQVDV